MVQGGIMAPLGLKAILRKRERIETDQGPVKGKG